MLPNFLINIFTSKNDIHDYRTRQSEFIFALPKPNTNFKKSFASRGVEAWNDLSSDPKKSINLRLGQFVKLRKHV